MPRKFLRRLSPSQHTLRAAWFLRPFGAAILDPALWRLDRHGACRAFSTGLFVAWMPVPFQMALAALAALVIRVHLPVALLSVWLSNPVTTLPMYYAAYRLGLVLLGMDAGSFHIELSMAWLGSELSRIWQPLLLGCLVLGTLTSVAGYFLLDVLWHWMLVRKYRRVQAAAQRRVERESSGRGA